MLLNVELWNHIFYQELWQFTDTMHIYVNRVSPATCLYTAMHGCYGLLWLAKEALYR